MEHANDRNHNRNSASWAGQPATALDAYTQLMNMNMNMNVNTGSTDNDLLKTEARQNPQSLIQAFNADLPPHDSQNGDFGQSPRLYINGAQADYTDLPFDLAIGVSPSVNNDFDIDPAYAAPYGAERPCSQSSHGLDDVASITFSTEDDLFDASFTGRVVNPLHSPAPTSFEDVILSRDVSVENSPGLSERPFLNIQTDNSSSFGPAIVASPSSAVSSAFGTGGGFTFQTTPTSAPRPSVSALATGLSMQDHLTPSPTLEYFERLSAQWADERNDFDQPTWSAGNPFHYEQTQPGPALVIDPPAPESVPMAWTRSDDFLSPSVPASPGMHPMDHLSLGFSGSREFGSQELLGVDNMKTTTGHLSVPPRVPAIQTRRKSDPPRPSPTLRAHFTSTRAPRLPDSRNQQFSSTSRSVPKQSPSSAKRQDTDPRRSQVHVSNSEASAPVPIVKRPTSTVRNSVGTSPNNRPMVPARGRRHGPMNSKSRAQAKDTRNKKMVCIRCKHSKQACKRVGNDPDSPCSQCEKHSLSNKWPGPCVKAHFEEIVHSGSCNYISQRFICHSTFDGTRRIRKDLPREFPIDGLIATLERVRPVFDFRVYYDGKPFYTMDLDKCHDYLVALRQHVGGAESGLRSFIDKEIVRIDPRNDEWESCTAGLRMEEDPLAVLCVLNNMPSRARYSYMFKNAYGVRQEQFVNPENPGEEDNLMLAAHLSRIICRKVEIKAYGHLQRELHRSDNLQDDDLMELLRKLGCILLTLRWRYAWWKVMLANPIATAEAGDPEKEQCERRVHKLCWVLYFYYCSLRRKLPAWSAVDGLRGVPSMYSDARQPIWDDFPGDDTEEAFEMWLEKGRELVHEAGVPEVLGSMGLSA
ncbi:Zn(II)2Cys6 transcription factor [Colletotrichum musicola]|uniref:Zn(II)2Cys6 transcription factor n=1 Tax=Colletotrichum musicola TaxID=2175873 RepID=A0A8H6ML44_9PEZI|nr:Zn(II)2Cys6 transcription factor [Colletotrichum musicola]